MIRRRALAAVAVAALALAGLTVRVTLGQFPR
jgi:hypothetical protein